jgi:ssDNA-binding replication factor A large subunit
MSSNLLDELEKKSGISKEKLKEMVREKMEEFKDLISEEGAIYLVARDLGIEMLEQIRRRLQIKNVIPGMKKVNLIGRVFKISPVIEFERQGIKGRVVNVFIGDSTGYVRVPLWNDQVAMVEENMIKVGDAVQLVNGFSRENIFGEVEVCLGKYGSIREAEDIDLPSVNELLKKFVEAKPERKEVKDLKLGKAEILATIVHVFRRKFLFEICPFCNAAVTNSTCEEHGSIKPEPALVISCIVDDGTSNLRAVFFREVAEKLCGLKTSEIEKLPEEERYKKIRENVLGKELILIGNVKKNKISGEKELIVNEIKDLNILEESKKLMEKIKLEGYHGKV